MGLALRPNIGMWKYIRICINTLTIEELTVSDYLKFKEGLTEAGASPCASAPCKEGSFQFSELIFECFL